MAYGTLWKISARIDRHILTLLEQQVAMSERVALWTSDLAGLRAFSFVNLFVCWAV